jgi:hypothetical protein
MTPRLVCSIAVAVAPCGRSGFDVSDTGGDGGDDSGGNQAMAAWARHVGLIDELAVYDRALTPAEITAHYELARGIAGR